MVKKKTDRLDAEKLAIFVKMQISSGEELIKPVYIPDEKIQEIRSLFTTYKLIRRPRRYSSEAFRRCCAKVVRPLTLER